MRMGDFNMARSKYIYKVNSEPINNCKFQVNNYESVDEDERFKFGEVEFVGVGAAYRNKPQKVKTQGSFGFKIAIKLCPPK